MVQIKKYMWDLGTVDRFYLLPLWDQNIDQLATFNKHCAFSPADFLFICRQYACIFI